MDAEVKRRRKTAKEINLRCQICPYVAEDRERLFIHDGQSHPRNKKGKLKVSLENVTHCEICQFPTNSKFQKLSHLIEKHCSFMSGFCSACCYYVNSLTEKECRKKRHFDDHNIKLYLY